MGGKGAWDGKGGRRDEGKWGRCDSDRVIVITDNRQLFLFCVRNSSSRKQFGTITALVVRLREE